MNIKLQLVSFLCATSILGTLSHSCISGGPSKDEAWDFPLPKAVVSLAVDRLTIRDAQEFALVSKGMRSAVEGSEAWKFFKNNGIRPEPSISLRQAMMAKLFFIDAKIAGYLCQIAQQKKNREEKAMQAAFDHSVELIAAGKKVEADRLFKEWGGHYKQMIIFQGEVQGFNEEDLRCIDLACDLGDADMIEIQFQGRRKHDSKLDPRGNSAFDFLDPFCQKGHVKARQLKRDALSLLGSVESDEAAKQLNQELIDEGHLEPYRFAHQHGYFFCIFDEGERKNIQTNLLKLKDEETIHELMSTAPTADLVMSYLYMLPLNRQTLRFVENELKEVRIILQNIEDSVERGYPSDMIYPPGGMYSPEQVCLMGPSYGVLFNVLQDWLDEHGVQFEPIVIRRDLGKDGDGTFKDEPQRRG